RFPQSSLSLSRKRRQPSSIQSLFMAISSLRAAPDNGAIPHSLDATPARRPASVRLRTVLAQASRAASSVRSRTEVVLGRLLPYVSERGCDGGRRAANESG